MLGYLPAKLAYEPPVKIWLFLRSDISVVLSAQHLCPVKIPVLWGGPVAPLLPYR